VFCSNCGKNLDEGAKFCGNCGDAVDLVTKKEKPVEKANQATSAGMVSRQYTSDRQSAGSTGEMKTPPRQEQTHSKKLFIFGGIAVAGLLVVMLCFIYFYRGTSGETKPEMAPQYTVGENKTIPKFSDYGTDMSSINKYNWDLDYIPIEACRAAWEKKNADAAYCLARRYPEDKNLLRDAANLGHPLARNDLGHILGDGDSDEKRKLIIASANSGIPHSQVTVGWWRMTGDHGFQIDYAEAMKWNLRAYNQGHSEGANNIGELYEKGLGVPKDLEQAKSWYEKASELGNAQATERLHRIEP